jgi:hypothetical protein
VCAAVGVGSQWGSLSSTARGVGSSTSERSKWRARPPPRENWDVGPNGRTSLAVFERLVPAGVVSLSIETGLLFLTVILKIFSQP